jgi:hypothetical protein
MHIQVFSEYLQLAQAGKVDFLACPMHKNDDAIFQLVHQDENNKVTLNCFACGYKITAGIVLYDHILAKIAEANEPKKVSPENE